MQIDKGDLPIKKFHLLLQSEQRTSEETEEMPGNPDKNLFTPQQWNQVLYLSQNTSTFKQLAVELRDKLGKWKEFLLKEDLYNLKLPENCEVALNNGFYKIILI